MEQPQHCPSAQPKCSFSPLSVPQKPQTLHFRTAIFISLLSQSYPPLKEFFQEPAYTWSCMKKKSQLMYYISLSLRSCLKNQHCLKDNSLLFRKDVRIKWHISQDQYGFICMEITFKLNFLQQSQKICTNVLYIWTMNYATIWENGHHSIITPCRAKKNGASDILKT